MQWSRLQNSYFRDPLEPFNRKVYWFIIILIARIWCDATLRLSPPIKLREWGCELNNSGSIKPIWMILPETSISRKELIRCKCKKKCSNRCSCKKTNLKCTEHCKCSGGCVKSNDIVKTIKTSLFSVLWTNINLLYIWLTLKIDKKTIT